MFIIYGNLNFIPGKYDEPVSAVVAACKDLEAYVIDIERTSTLTYYFGVPEEVGTHGRLLEADHDDGARSHTLRGRGGVPGQGDMKECGIFYDTRIKAADRKRDEVLARFGKLAKWVEENEKETITYLVLRSLANEDEVRVFERYASRKALEAHQCGKEYLELLTGSKDIIKSMEGRGYIPNGHGWLHR